MASSSKNRVCKYCGEPLNVQEDEDLHNFLLCPMLISCKHCYTNIEIQSYAKHLLDECTAAQDNYTCCPSCNLSVVTTELDNHREDIYCWPSEPGTSKCQLCYGRIGSEKNAWKDHLAGPEDGCKENPRRIPFLRRQMMHAPLYTPRIEAQENIAERVPEDSCSSWNTDRRTGLTRGETNPELASDYIEQETIETFEMGIDPNFKKVENKIVARDEEPPMTYLGNDTSDEECDIMSVHSENEIENDSQYFLPPALFNSGNSDFPIFSRNVLDHGRHTAIGIEKLEDNDSGRMTSYDSTRHGNQQSRISRFGQYDGGRNETSTTGLSTDSSYIEIDSRSIAWGDRDLESGESHLRLVTRYKKWLSDERHFWQLCKDMDLKDYLIFGIYLGYKREVLQSFRNIHREPVDFFMFLLDDWRKMIANDETCKPVNDLILALNNVNQHQHALELEEFQCQCSRCKRSESDIPQVTMLITQNTQRARQAYRGEHELNAERVKVWLWNDINILNLARQIDKSSRYGLGTYLGFKYPELKSWFERRVENEIEIYFQLLEIWRKRNSVNDPCAVIRELKNAVFQAHVTSYIPTLNSLICRCGLCMNLP